jgi:hypothetical protein
VAEFFGVEVEIFVIEAVFHVLADEVGEVLQVNEHAGFGVGFAGDFDFEFVVVAMPVGVVADTEDFAVPLVRPMRAVQPVGGVEMGFSKNGDAQGVGVG